MRAASIPHDVTCSTWFLWSPLDLIRMSLPAPSTPSASAGGQGATGGGNVKVVARIRPQNEIEVSRGGSVCVFFPNKETVELRMEEGTQFFAYDRAFGWDASQQDVFDFVAAPLIKDTLEGYNCTIFAYGQTSSGKTFTMEGPSLIDSESRGIIPRTVAAIFEGVAVADPSIEFTIKVSYVEIYMERIRDLLDPFKTKNNLHVREDKRKGIYIAGVTEAYVTNEAELLAVMAEGQKNRAVAATGMNEGSSRSHSVFFITITQRDTATSSTKTSKLVLVDLAGSEMVRKTQASGQQLEEAKTINKSLSALGLVINALTDDKISHIPYRDSKLTRVLQDSLGGNSRTALIINASPSTWNANETLSTLRFGSRAKAIQNKAVVNEVRSTEELNALLAKAEKEIDMQQSFILSLEAQLQQYKDSGIRPAKAAPVGNTGLASSEEQLASIIKLEHRIEELTLELQEEKEEGRRKESENRALQQIAREESSVIAEARAKIKALEEANESLKASAEASRRERDEALLVVQDMRTRQQDLVERNSFALQESSLVVEKLQLENERLTSEVEELTRRMATLSPPPPPPQDDTAAPALEAQGGDASDPSSAKSPQQQQYQRAVAHVSVLQEKLEQLIGVHRQLLRRYSGLEGEAAEARKKVGLRDDRIKQLEHSCRLLEDNLRGKAAQHIRELTDLREQVAKMKDEQVYFSKMREQDLLNGAWRTIRGGRPQEAGMNQPRAIRGGTRRLSVERNNADGSLTEEDFLGASGVGILNTLKNGLNGLLG